MSELEELAQLIASRNQVAAQITRVIGRPAQIGHVGEFIASRVFDIALETSATAKGIDGHFASGFLAGRSVNVKWYAKLEGLLDITPDSLPDFYLIMAGPRSAASSSRGEVRPWTISTVHLLEAAPLVARLHERGVRIGIATSVRQSEFAQGEVYPSESSLLPLSLEQRRLLALFGKGAA
ncbi:MAG: hypothetical protein CL908_09010 [Deltaproteobacteria bacterium]|nr:hypothetical protein [Deltaproteobacteria bacterium]